MAALLALPLALMEGADLLTGAVTAVEGFGAVGTEVVSEFGLDGAVGIAGGSGTLPEIGAGVGEGVGLTGVAGGGIGLSSSASVGVAGHVSAMLGADAIAAGEDALVGAGTGITAEGAAPGVVGGGAAGEVAGGAAEGAAGGAVAGEVAGGTAGGAAGAAAGGAAAGAAGGAASGTVGGAAVGAAGAAGGTTDVIAMASGGGLAEFQTLFGMTEAEAAATMGMSETEAAQAWTYVTKLSEEEILNIISNFDLANEELYTHFLTSFGLTMTAQEGVAAWAYLQAIEHMATTGAIGLGSTESLLSMTPALLEMSVPEALVVNTPAYTQWYLRLTSLQLAKLMIPEEMAAAEAAAPWIAEGSESSIASGEFESAAAKSVASARFPPYFWQNTGVGAMMGLISVPIIIEGTKHKSRSLDARQPASSQKIEALSAAILRFDNGTVSDSDVDHFNNMNMTIVSGLGYLFGTRDWATECKVTGLEDSPLHGMRFGNVSFYHPPTNRQVTARWMAPDATHNAADMNVTRAFSKLYLATRRFQIPELAKKAAKTAKVIKEAKAAKAKNAKKLAANPARRALLWTG